ncbi:deoxyribose-phosphate aldolase [Vallitalea sp.]|jgi:deoxyribose-phosphate aldolase|uniref:deoxyribose-phosphate aldolase n=1 Tax=Vallitalea sp. TaxID=1882829 RepID=UPI0025D43101|nr:deoxyribose-phosphate aldolase [Vallitalea sp.]MCT4687924.1 deoxyribose-phosphate aldolase [Vallitalea sp.]
MTKLGVKEIPRLIDISAVRTDVTLDEVNEIVAIAKKYNFICTFVMPCFTDILIKQLKNDDNILVGGVVGFPSGADLTKTKVDTTISMIQAGCDEIDMVINVGALKSEKYDLVYNDIKAVVDVVGDIPVKAIIEIAYLTDDEIKIASKLAVKAGVTYVKTGTGWASKPSTVNTVKIIKEVVKDDALIKVAGGVRSLATLEEMYEAGARRFGISMTSALKILKEAYDREDMAFEEEFNLESVSNY